MRGHHVRVDLRVVPTGDVTMNPVHEGSVIAYLGRHGSEEMPDPLLVLNIDLEVTEHDNATFRTNTLFPPAELPTLHITFHDVDAVFLIKTDPGYFIETDDIILADEPTLPIGIIDEHFGNGRFPTTHQMRIGADLLEEVTLTGSSRAEFDTIVPFLHKGDHPKEKDRLGARRKC